MAGLIVVGTMRDGGSLICRWAGRVERVVWSLVALTRCIISIAVNVVNVLLAQQRKHGSGS